MRFRDGQAIHEQIVDYVIEEILARRWDEERRLPSVRELAVELGVNPNTVQRSFGSLQDLKLIYNRRGIGHFVAPDAADRARELRRDRLEHEVLPDLFRQMRSLDLDLSDLSAAWSRWQEG